MNTSDIYSRINITGKPDRHIERTMLGIMRNMRDDCIVDEDVFSDTELPTGLSIKGEKKAIAKATE